VNFSRTSTLQAGGNRTGLSAGLMMDVPWFASLSIEPEINYVQRGNNGNGPNGPIDPLAASADYLELPIHAKFSIGDLGGIRPFVLAGPYFAFKLLQRLRDALPSWFPLTGVEGGRPNLVPVDYVAAAMAEIASKPRLDGKTFHIVDPAPALASSVQIQPPVGATPAAFGKPVAEKTIAAPERVYRVKNTSETFYQIAGRTLTNVDRWTEIYKLNPRFDPKFPVPAGTELRLPADAKIDPQDAVQ